MSAVLAQPPNITLVRLAQLLRKGRTRASILSKQGKNPAALAMLAELDQLELDARTVHTLSQEDGGDEDARIQQLVDRAHALLDPPPLDAPTAEWLTFDEAAALTGISRSTIWSHSKSGKLKSRNSPARKNGVQVLRSEVMALTRQARAPRPKPVAMVPIMAPPAALVVHTPIPESSKIQPHHTVVVDAKWWTEAKPEPPMVNPWNEVQP